MPSHKNFSGELKISPKNGFFLVQNGHISHQVSGTEKIAKVKFVFLSQYPIYIMRVEKRSGHVTA